MLQRLRNRIATGEREGGFTLIELLVVLIIIAVLLAIAIPSYLGFRARAEQRTAESNVRAAVPAAEAYYQDFGTYAGMDTAALTAIDAGLSDDIVVVAPDDDSYCLQTDVPGNAEASYAGPGGDVTNALCA
jgi:prepilin-type N-terminal cleavage/methylation domain-containing protein